MGSESDCGLLASLVKDIVKHLADQRKNAPSTMTRGKKVLLWMLTDKDTAQNKTHQRSHLRELLLFLAETASQPHGPDKLRQCTKSFTLFLLRNVLSSSKNETPIEHERLLKSLALPDLAIIRKKDPDLFRTRAKMAIVAHIVGDNSMDSVVTLCDGKMKAFAEDGPKSLPKMAKTDRLAALWATDDFDYQEMDVNDEIAFIVTGQAPPSIKAKTDASATAAVTITAAATATTLDPATQAEVISNFNRMEECARKLKKKELTLNGGG